MFCSRSFFIKKGYYVALVPVNTEKGCIFMKKALFKCIFVAALGMCLVGSFFFSSAGVAHAASIPHAASRHVSMPANYGEGCSYSSDGILEICLSFNSQLCTFTANVYTEPYLPSCDVWIAVVEYAPQHQQWGDWHSCSNKIGWVGGEQLTTAWAMKVHGFASVQNYYRSTTSVTSPEANDCC